MKNLWILAIGSFVMTGCIENKSTETVKEDKKEVVSTSNEIKNPPRVESPADVNLREGTGVSSSKFAKGRSCYFRKRDAI